MGSLGVPELVIIFLIIMVLFGASRLPAMGKGLGEGIKNFKKGIKGDDSPERYQERLDEKAAEQRNL
jgi:sec-independent protein translocase protein TatA